MNILVLTVTVFVLLLSGRSPMAIAGENFVVALPKDYADDPKGLEKTVSDIFLGIKPGDRLAVLNAPDRQLIANIEIPQGSAGTNRQLRVSLVGPQLKPVGQFIASSTSAARAVPPSNIMLPQFLRDFANVTLPTLPGKSAELLVIGSPHYFDRRERFSTLEGHFPSDGHLKSSETETPFSSQGREASLSNVNVHYCFTRTDWIDDLHRQKMHRFWSLYIQSMNGKLATFVEADLKSCVERLLKRISTNGESFVADPTETKPEMIRILRGSARVSEAPAPLPAAPPASSPGVPVREARPVDSSDLFGKVTVETAPAAQTVGKLRLGITWNCAGCDLDIYARAAPNEPFLFWHNPSSPEGRHHRDWLLSPAMARQHEVIEFAKAIDASKLQIFIHHYAGGNPGGVAGTLRIWLDGKVFEKPFHVASSTGDRRGLLRPDLAQRNANWLRIDPRDVLNLNTGN